MAEPRNMSVDVNIDFNVNYPRVPSTMEERIKAAQVARPLLTASTPVTSSAVNSTDIVYLAEYLATGHTYFDTHPDKPIKAKQTKKQKREMREELRKLVQEEVEEQLDQRERDRGTLFVPKIVVEGEE